MGEHVAVSYGIIAAAKTLDTVLLFPYTETNVGANYSERNVSSVKDGQIVL